MRRRRLGAGVSESRAHGATTPSQMSSGTFTSVREMAIRGQLADPFDIKFSADVWKSEVQANPTDENIRLLSAALICNDISQGILKRLETTGYFQLEPLFLAVMLVTFVNSQAALLHRDTFRPSWTNPNSYFGHIPVAQGDPSGRSGDDIHTALADGLQLPIQYLLRTKPNATGLLEHFKKSVEIAPEVVNICSAWNSAKEVWQMCLFQGASLMVENGTTLFQGTSENGYFVLGRYTQSYENAMNFRREVQHPGGFHGVESQRYGRDGINLTFDTRPAPLPPALTQFSMDDFSKTFILPSELGKTGLAVHQVMQVREVLASIAVSTMTRISDAQEHDETVWLDQQGRYSLTSLADAIQFRLQLTKDQAYAALSLLTHDFGLKYDPWTTPLLDAGDGTASLCLGILAWSNRTLALQRLLKRGNYDLSARGHDFDQFVKRFISAGVANCSYGQIIRVSDASVRLRHDRDSEEVDLLLSIGSDVYVIENKLTQFPVELNEDRHFVERMKQADDQLKRKVAFVHARKSMLRTLHPSLANFPSTAENVRGVIVTNFFGGRGTWTEHPISDASSIASYFSMGYYANSMAFNPDGSLDPSSANFVPLYNSFASMKANFYKYLEFSPHSRAFESYLKPHDLFLDFSKFGLRNIRGSFIGLTTPDNESELDESLRDLAESLRRKLAS